MFESSQPQKRNPFFSRPDKVLIKVWERTSSKLPCTNPLTEQHICVLVQEEIATLRTFSTISIFPDLCPTLFSTCCILSSALWDTRVHWLRENVSYSRASLYNPTTVYHGYLGPASMRICGKQRGVKNTGSASRISPIFRLNTPLL